MADPLKAKGEALIKSLVTDVKGKMDVISKVKEMAKIAKELGEDTADVDSVIEASEGFADMVIKRFDKTVLKE